MHKFLYNQMKLFSQADEGAGGGAAAETPAAGAGQSMDDGDTDDDGEGSIPEDFGMGDELDVEVPGQQKPAATDGQAAPAPAAATPGQPAAAAPAAQVPAAQPAPAPAQPAAAAPAPPAQAAQPEAVQPAAVPGAEAQAPLTMEQVRQNYQEARNTAIGLIAEHHYKLDDATLQELEENPGVAVPKLLSRVYMDAITASTAHMVQSLPEMVDAVIQGRAAAEKSEGDFFNAWPQLKAHADGMKTVQQLGQAYRSMYPHASKEDFIKMVGAQSMIALGIQGTMATPGAAPTAAAMPAKPFQPAGARGAARASVQPQAQGNVFAALVDEENQMDADD